LAQLSIGESSDWDEQVDVVIIGAGAAGLTGAIAASRQNLRPVVFEKAGTWGGTTALSGGAVWAPANRLQLQAGIGDSVEAAAAYLDEIVDDHGLATSADRRMAFLRNAPFMVDALLEEGMKWRVDPQPDYVGAPHASVSRDLDADLVDLKILGAWRHSMRRGGSPFALRVAEFPALGRAFTSFSSTWTLVRILLRQRISRWLGRELVGCGESLAAQLMAIVQRKGIEVRLNSRLHKIILSEGRAAGVVILQSDGRRKRIKANKGVFLAAGGFSRSGAHREKLQGFDGQMSSASPDDTGDIIQMADELGAQTALMSLAWYATSFLYPGNIPVFFQWERTLPFAFIVDDRGQRIADESGNYDTFGAAMLRRGIRAAWLIMDGTHRRRYSFGAMRPGVTPDVMFERGFFRKADTIDDLAGQCGIDVVGLRTTIERFNGFADRGIDEDFGRGNKPYDHYWGDPHCKPNPCLGKIQNPPFLATRVYVGDLGTRGGFVTDVDSRVLNQEDQPIPGLYAAGNSAAAVVGSAYPGPGATLGPAMTFAFLAMKHIAAGSAP
jgi:3-oxosteroid 1-dehydrogenase